MMRALRRWREDCQGAIAVEAAFLLPLLLLAGFGAIDASYLLLQNHKMEAGLANAGSYLARTTNPEGFEARAKRLAATGSLDSGAAPRIKNWTESDVAIQYRSVVNSVNANGETDYRGGDTIRVAQISSSLTYQGFGILKAVTGGAVTITARHEQRLIGENR